MHVPFAAKYMVVGHPPEQVDPETQAVAVAAPPVATVYPTFATVQSTALVYVAQFAIAATQAPEIRT